MCAQLPELPAVLLVPKGINYASAKVYPQSKKLLWLACVRPSRNIFAKTFFFFFTSSAKYFYTTNVLSCLLEKYYKKWIFHAYLLTQIFESFFFPFLLYVSLQHENSKFIQFSFFCHDFQFR